MALERMVLDAAVTIHIARRDAYGLELLQRFDLQGRPVAPLICAATIGEVLRIAHRIRPASQWDVASPDDVVELLGNLNVVQLSGGPIEAEYGRISAMLDDDGTPPRRADAWVAATASVHNATVLTHSSDFERFRSIVSCEIIDRGPYLT